MGMNRKIVVIIVLAVAAVAGILVALSQIKPWNQQVELKAEFRDAEGLRKGAPVRLAGVEVGRVTSVRARSDVQGGVAEVVIVLSTPYELKIPSDSTVSLSQAGVLGDIFVEINLGSASGAPVASGSVLKAQPVAAPGTNEFLEQLERATRPCPERQQSEPPVGIGKTKR